MKVILDTDTYNEADDIFAIAYLLKLNTTYGLIKVREFLFNIKLKVFF